MRTPAPTFRVRWAFEMVVRRVDPSAAMDHIRCCKPLRPGDSVLFLGNAQKRNGSDVFERSSVVAVEQRQ